MVGRVHLRGNDYGNDYDNGNGNGNSNDCRLARSSKLKPNS